MESTFAEAASLGADTERCLSDIFFKIYPSYKPGQEMTIRAVLGGYDTLAVLPTGSGKTTCFMVPGLVMQKLFCGKSVIVCPTVAICEQHASQINHICGSGTAVYYKGLIDTVAALTAGTCFIIAAPEALPSLTDELVKAGTRINLLVADEVHLVGNWG